MSTTDYVRTTSQHPSLDAKKLKQLRSFAKVLDEAFVIPGTNYRMGADSIIGLLPVGGDVAGFLISAMIIFQAKKLGIPKHIEARMWKNVAVDAAAGFVPIVGDLVDVAWKANRKNVDLLENFLRAEGRI